VETRGKKDDTLGEEVSAFGQRVKGAAKDVVGDAIDDEEMEAEGKVENAVGRARQATNDVMKETDGVRGATVNPSAHATGSVTEEVSATGQRIKGATKDVVGDAIGNTRMEREGEIENAAGRARQAANDVTGDVTGRTVTPGIPAGGTGSVTEEVSATAQRAKGAVKDVVGDAIGSPRMEREGEIENAAGRARQQSNDVIGGRTADRVSGSGYVTGLYTTPEAASRAYDGLTTKHGYKPSDVNVVMSDDTRRRHFGDVKPGTELHHGTKAAEGLGAGAAIGGGLGAALAAAFAVGSSLVIPGLGLVVAGPIAAALAGAGAGAATGGIVGALIGAGIPEDRVRDYERGINDGGIVIGTKYRDPDHARELERDYTSYGGTHVRY
jgi:uncharacterized protein YjbJ (UPF0337 family)